MRLSPLPFAGAFTLCLLALAGCKRHLDTPDVQAFVDAADAAARNRFAPEICALRGKDFVLKLHYQSLSPHAEPTTAELRRALYCREAGRFSKLRRYKLERESLEITLAPDRKTATTLARYVQTMPYFEEGMVPVSVDDFRDYVIIESVDRSQIGIEGGELVFLGTEVSAVERELVPRSQLHISPKFD